MTFSFSRHINLRIREYNLVREVIITFAIHVHNYKCSFQAISRDVAWLPGVFFLYSDKFFIRRHFPLFFSVASLAEFFHIFCASIKSFIFSYFCYIFSISRVRPSYNTFFILFFPPLELASYLCFLAPPVANKERILL